MGSLFIPVVVIGPILLAAVILWAIRRNKKTTGSDLARTDAGTRELYREEDDEADHDTAIGGAPRPKDVRR